MTANEPTPSSDQIHSSNQQSSSIPIAHQAALIATFYYQRDLTHPLTPQDAAQQLVKHLETVFDLEPLEAEIWYNSETGTILHCFESTNPVAHDTVIVQLELKAKNKSQSAAIAWSDDLWARFASVRNHPALLNGVIGYTLTYHATLSPAIILDALSLKKVLADTRTRSLHFRSLDELQELAVMKSHDGYVWLLDIPLEGEGIQVATIYAALYPQNAQESFEQHLLWGPNTELFMPDLVAHKSYHQIREYQHYDDKMGYSQKLERLRHATAAFLADSSQQSLTEELSNLQNDTHLLTSSVTLLDLQHISLVKQLFNYGPYTSDAQEGDIFKFHHNHIKTAVRELELKVKEGRTVLGAAETAHKLLEQRQKKAETIEQQLEQRRQQFIGMIVGLFGAALAVPQLIDREAVAALQAWYYETATKAQLDLLYLVTLQIVLTVVVGIFIGGLLLLAYNLVREDESDVEG